MLIVFLCLHIAYHSAIIREFRGNRGDTGQTGTGTWFLSARPGQ